MLKPTDDESCMRHWPRQCACAKKMQTLTIWPGHCNISRIAYTIWRRFSKPPGTISQLGPAEGAHAVLVNAIEAARGEELHDREQQDETLGL